MSSLVCRRRSEDPLQPCQSPLMVKLLHPYLYHEIRHVYHTFLLYSWHAIGLFQICVIIYVKGSVLHRCRYVWHVFKSTNFIVFMSSHKYKKHGYCHRRKELICFMRSMPLILMFCLYKQYLVEVNKLFSWQQYLWYLKQSSMHCAL